jgi:N-carbamoyl-L-amino-acid hydrolase
VTASGVGEALRQEFHRLFAAFAAIGATSLGGVRRLTGTPEDGAARDLLAATLTAAGAEALADAVGNQFGLFRLPGAGETAVLSGSHLDSQPTGGRFDGAYGVIAAVVAAQAVRARLAAEGRTARHHLAVVNWMNEEGARFQPSLTGSSVFTGALAADAALGLVDGDGVKLGDALAAIGWLGTDTLPVRPVRAVELHVEQGAVLESAGVPVGLVTGAWATRKLCLAFVGEPSHTGPTPMARRRDGLRAAARAIEALYGLVESAGRGAHASAARLTIAPNSPNVVASEVRVWFEIRHPQQAEVDDLAERFLTLAAAGAAPLGVVVETAIDERRPALPFDPAGVETVRAAAAALGLAAMETMTVAGHDVLALQRKIPGTLIFVPSVGGLSHNEREFTAAADLERGLDVLAETLWRMVTAD